MQLFDKNGKPACDICGKTLPGGEWHTIERLTEVDEEHAVSFYCSEHFANQREAFLAGECS